MKIISTTLVVIFIFLLSGLQIAAAHDGVNTTIHMDEKGFSPSVIQINQGEKVVFENIGKNPAWPASNIHPTHDIYPEFDPTKIVKPGESWSFVFNKSGIWKMHDHIYPQFTGTITVKANKDQVAKTPQNLSLFERILRFFKINKEPKSETSKITSYKFDNNIQKNSSAIFTDDNALYSYVKKFGSKSTVQRLYTSGAEKGLDCHQRAHKAGNIAYEIYDEKAFQNCSAECHSGCYHGAVEAYFKKNGTENLEQNLQTICNSELNSFFSHQCIHGIGHGLMAWSNYQLFDALKACNLLTKGQNSCWTGVFMENIVGGIAEKDVDKNKSFDRDHFTKYLNDDPQYPCSIVEDKYKSACYLLQTSRMMQLYQGDFTKIASACTKALANYQYICFQSMGRDVGGVYRDNPQGAIEACSNAPKGNHRINCLKGAVQDSFWDPSGQNKSLEFCSLLQDRLEKDACYEEIFARAPQVLTSKPDLEKFCQKAEEPYQALCRSNQP